MIKTVRDLNIRNKRVIIRVDFNVPMEDGRIVDDNRIRAALDTINYCIENNTKVILLSHLGRVKEPRDLEKNDMAPVAERLSQLLKKHILFSEKTRGPELENIVSHMKYKDVLLIQNTRYEDLDGKKESTNDPELGAYWASFGDVFINDAFGTVHRAHASNCGIAKHLPSAFGFLIEKELKALGELENPEHPFVLILGGAKVADKIGVIENLVTKADKILIGGGMAFTFLKAKGYEIGDSLYSIDYVDEVKELLNEYSSKIVMPIDVVVNKDDNISNIDIKEMESGSIYDLGPKTLQVYRDILDESETVFINGTIGLYEDERYRQGTIELFEILKRCNNIKIAGGGDALASINTLGYQDAFNYLSTGGGATLDYIASKKLKCFEE